MLSGMAAGGGSAQVSCFSAGGHEISPLVIAALIAGEQGRCEMKAFTSNTSKIHLLEYR